MKQTFKEVAHLYTGCQMNNGTTLESVDDGEWMLSNNTHKGCSNFRPEWDEDVKPILRKISTITEKENEGWNKISTPIGEMCIESASQIHWAKRLTYYRSLQMDCDDLIENGYAVEMINFIS